ncbi:MAG TPA: type IV pilus modification protein PilV [Thermoanaerobaculia bacterium]|nr:type IV pilus modification protein PilV [Burkholderiales bacterium]HYC61708.1 type IV pilus modification protein PilV [Thermoanaerobaculia bacterium]
MQAHRTAGFTMLEILISIVIIAFGLLGIAGLQAYALKHNHSASLRLTATALAADMIDRMKANPAGVGGGGTTLEGQYNKSDTADYASAVPSCTDPTGSCTPTELAANDRFEWQTRVSELLPGGVGVVCRDSTPTDGEPTATECDNIGEVAYVIKIWWTDHRTTRAGANPERQLFWTSFNP